MRRLAVLAAIAAAVIVTILIARPDSEQPSLRTPDSSSPPAPASARPDVPPAPQMEARDSAATTHVDLPFDQRNLYADFQAAIGSSDRKTVEAGLVAWRKCLAHVALGSGDIEDWVAMVMPADLPRDEWDRRARYARASAARCAGFARQGDLYEQSEALSRKAIELGSVSEALLLAIVDYARMSAPPAASLVAPSCDQVKQYVAGEPEGIRRITPAMRNAARARASHFLNGASDQARTIAINLALCDLDPQRCGIHSNFVGSLCVHSGKCDYLNEVDYWKGETPAEVWSDAQGVRAKLVAAVKAGDCQSLF
jgi:hypothetical protein